MVPTNSKSVKPRPPILATIITLVAVVIMFGLGEWQLQRAETKRERLSSIEQRQNLSPFSVAEISLMQGDIRDLPFSVKGTINPEQYFLLDNKINQGQVGYQVIAPLQTIEGVLLVNFGWVKAGLSRQQLPDIKLPIGSIELSGITSVPSNNPMINETVTAGQSWPVLIQQIDISLMSQFVNEPALPYLMLLNPSHEFGWVRDWNAVVMSPEKHLGYAIQWFLLAVACVIIYFVALKRRNKTSHE